MTYKRVRRARAGTAVVDAYVGPIGELVIDTDLLEIRLQNGVAGGLRVPRFGGPAVFTTGSFADGTAALPSITNTGDLNTGIYFPAADTVAISTAGVERLQVDPAGNAGLGATPSAWGGNFLAFQNRNGSIYTTPDFNNTILGHNTYFDGSVNRYIFTGFASYVQQGAGNGSIVFNTAPSGTAGNPITFTQAATLFQSGTFAVGPTATDSGDRVVSAIDSNGLYNFKALNNGAGGTYFLAAATGENRFRIQRNGADGSIELGAIQAVPLVLVTGNTEAARFTPSRNLLVGRTGDLGYKLDVLSAGNLVANLSSGQGNLLVTTPASGETLVSTAGSLLLGAGSSEAARITSARYFKASNTGTYPIEGITGDGSSLSVHQINSNANEATLVLNNSNTGSNTTNAISFLATGANGFHYQGFVNGTSVYQVLANGNVQNTNNSYGAISQRSLKNLIAQKTGADYWEKFKQVKFWIYSLLADPTNQQLLGVVAEELEEIWPGLIERTKNVIKVQKQRQVEQTRQVTITEKQKQSGTEIKLIDGKYVQVTTTKTVDVQVPQFDTFTVYDEAGAVVMKLVTPEVQAVAAQEEVTDEEGNVIQSAIAAVPYQAAVYEPLTHQVPRMETITITETYEESEEDGTETLAVKYSILGLIADTITQELQFRVEDLTARLTALEAA